MAKTFKPKKKEISAVQWNGDNADEVTAFLPQGNAVKRGRSLAVSSKHFMSLLSIGDWITMDGDKLVAYTDEVFKDKFEEKSESL